jgi:hypothetical protein
MEDIGDATSVATSAPEEAAKNISNANLFSVDPRYAADNKQVFNQKADQILKPQQAEKPVADYMRQSSEHAALAAPDVDKLSYISRQMKMIGDYVYDRPTTEHQIVDLNLKKMNNGGKLDPDDEIKLLSANQDSQDQQTRNYGLNGPLDKIPAMILGGISDFGQSIVRGARKGLMEGPLPNRGYLPVAANIYYGAMVKDPFDTLSAGMYNELSNLTGADGTPKNLDHDTKLAYARGVGVVGTALMNGAGLAVAEATPFLKPFINPALAKGFINTPAKAAIITGLGNAIKGSAAVGGASGFTEVAKILAEEMGKNKGTDEAGFWNSLATATTKANAARVASATGQGALMGAAFELPLQLGAYGATKQRFSQGFEQYLRNRPETRDVTPEAPKQLPGARAGAPPDIDITPVQGGGGNPQLEQSYKALQLNEALHQINDVQKSTKMNEIAPAELNEVNKQGFAAAGMNKFYSTFSAMRDWATSEEKGLAARKLIDPTGVAAGQMNAPFELAPHDVMEIAKDYPDILDHVQFSPDGPNGIQAKEHIEAMDRAEQQRKNVMTKLGIAPEEVQPESNVTTLEQPAKEEQPPLQMEAIARQTQELLDQKKALQENLELLKQHADRNVVLPDSMAEFKKTKKSAEDAIVKIDEHLANLKEQVTQQFKDNPPGSVLSFPYDEEKAANAAEMRFGREPTFTDALRTVLPEEQVAKFDDAVLASRQHVINAVHDQAVHEMNKVVDQTIAMAQEDARRSELERIAHDPNYATVDKFHSHQIANSKGKNKRSMYAIDPTTLPADLAHFAENPQLKAHKVFAKGANSAEDSARALGYANGKELLDVLSKTPTRKQILEARAQFYDSHIESMARAGVDLDHTNIMKAFTEKTKAYLEGMRFLKDTDWSATKFGIQKIALPLPKIEEIEYDARSAVKSTKVGSLSVSQFAVGERQSYKMAVQKFLRGDLAGAFQAKEMSARNASMQREIRKAIAEINRAQKFFRRLEEPAALEVMRAAGKTSQKALDEITDVFNFNPKRKGQSEQNSFNKWVRKEVDAGRGDFSIPDRLSDIRQSIDEMTVEQVAVAFDRAKTIFNEAKYKAELIENKDLREEERSIDRIAENVMLAANEHPSSSDDNFKPVQGNKTPHGAMRLFLQDKQTAFTNMEHIIRFYDQEKFNGFFQETFMHQLKGDGKFDKKSGYSKENLMIEKFAKTARQIMDNHGSYDQVEKTRLSIPEFADVPSLDNGNLTKGDLMTFWAYKGDPQGREKLAKNFLDKNGKSISLETWQKVFDRELTKADVTAMQYSVDMYKSYQDETRDLQNRTKGEDVTFVKGVPNEHNGEFYPGGYVPLKYKHEWSAEAAKQAIQMLEDKRAAWFTKDDGADFGKQFAAEQTEQGRLIERSDSDKPLDGSLMRFWRGHEEVIHDLSYREPVMNTLKLLRDKRVREAMIRMGGESRFNLVVNTVIEMAGRAEALNANYFSDQNRFFKNMFGHLQNNFNITVLGLNIFTSTPIQYESLGQLWQNMGPKGLQHFATVNAKIMSHPHLWGGFYDFANELDPTIGHFMEQLQNKITSQVHDIIPSKSVIPYASPFVAAHEWAVNKAMSPMALADIHLKVMGALSAYDQFISGHAENWPIERVQGLSEADRHKQAQAYVRQISRLSLTHGRPEDQAPIQKSPITHFFSNYWNDARNVLNNQISQAHKVSWNAQKGYQAGKEGDYKKSAGYFGTATGVAMATMVFATLSRWYSDKLRGIQQTPDQWDVNLKTPEGLKDAAYQMGQYMMLSPADQFASVEPIMRETFFAEQMPDKVIRGYVDKSKTVQLPITKMLSDIATAGNTLTDAVQQAHNLTDFLQYLTNLDNKETKALLNAESYLGIPLPVNAYSHLMRLMDLPLNAPAQVPMAAFDKLNGSVGAFLKKQSGPDHLEVKPEFHAQLEKIQEQLKPVTADVPQGMSDTMKYAMSGADWTKPNGIYGFSKDKWDYIRVSAPDLGLTPSGRISKDLGQQEKAMDWYLHNTSQELAKSDIPVNKASLYGAFRLGEDKYEALYKAPYDAKLKTVLGNEALDKNPDFSQFKTVGQLKIYLNSEVEKAAAKTHSPTPQLTQPTAKAED